MHLFFRPSFSNLTYSVVAPHLVSVRCNHFRPSNRRRSIHFASLVAFCPDFTNIPPIIWLMTKPTPFLLCGHLLSLCRVTTHSDSRPRYSCLTLSRFSPSLGSHPIWSQLIRPTALSD